MLSLQPFDRHLEGKDGDVVMAKNFIGLALPRALTSRSVWKVVSKHELAGESK